MNEKRTRQISKFFSKHLRHAPEAIGLTLQKGGWVFVDDLLQACQKHGLSITLEELEDVVATNDKKRFAFDATGTRIRANQGHSVEVDLELEPTVPPSYLYHGTTISNVELILKSGLQKMRRHHVHLSPNQETAWKVGSRHGKPTILLVDSGTMHKDGFVFYVSDNGVWLTERVPPKYLQILEETKT